MTRCMFTAASMYISVNLLSCVLCFQNGDKKKKNTCGGLRANQEGGRAKGVESPWMIRIDGNGDSVRLKNKGVFK